MPPTQAEIERIVREVAARLRGMNLPDSVAGGELAISARVVTLQEIEGRLAGIARVQVSRGAIVTPAVRDRLADLQICLVRDGRANDAATRWAKPAGSLAIAVAETPFRAVALLRALAASGHDLPNSVDTTLVLAVKRLTEHVHRGGCLGVLLTGRTEAAACLANRRPGVRAVVVDRWQTAQASVRAIGANLLIVDPAGMSEQDLEKVVEGFRDSGSLPCPAQWAAELGG